MENIIDLIASDASASEVSDTIKNHLFAKAAQRVEMGRPEVAATMFAEPEVETEVEPDQEPQEDQE